MANLVKASDQEYINQVANAFDAFGDTTASSNIVGTLLKFNKGDWLLGRDQEEVEEGTKFVVLMDDMQVGWQKWMDSKPTEQRFQKITDPSFQHVSRKDLDAQDESEWEIGDDGKPRDPWSATSLVFLKNVGDYGEEATLYTLPANSKGLLKAVGELSKIYAAKVRQDPSVNPIVEVGSDSYMHPNKAYGRIKTPTLKVVDWEPKESEVTTKKVSAPVKKAEPAKKQLAPPAKKAPAPAKRR